MNSQSYIEPESFEGTVSEEQSFTDGALYILSMVDAVLHRPPMYTVTGTYEEVVSFLEGWYSGVMRYHFDNGEGFQWTQFRHWLAKDLGVSLSEEFRHISESMTDSKMAFLVGKWNEYKHLTETDLSSPPNS